VSLLRGAVEKYGDKIHRLVSNALKTPPFFQAGPQVRHNRIAGGRQPAIVEWNRITRFGFSGSDLDVKRVAAMSEFRDSEFRDFAMLRVGASPADPEALARAVRKHKAGDVMAQVALTFALMLAICAVTFVLTVDRAAAMTLAGAAFGSEEMTMVTQALGAMPLAILAALALGGMFAAYRAAQRAEEARLVRVPVRARRRG
jgi:hypothetical protein